MVELPIIDPPAEPVALAIRARPLRVVHLPYYPENAYQPLLQGALERRGIEVVRGGGGGNFLRSALFRWKADVLHFHWLHPYLLRDSRWGSLLRSARFWVEIALIKARGVKIVWTVHNLQNHDRKHTGLETWFTRRFARLADRVIVHCAVAKAEAERLFGVERARIEIIMHGNLACCYPNAISGAEARRRLGLDASNLVYLFLGRIEPYKGVLDLVRAFRGLDAPDARLVIAGRTAQEDVAPAVQAAIGDDQRILFRPGYVPDNEIQTFMNAADAVVFPYRDILTSGAVILAMSFGRACIAPRRGCIPETLGADGGVLFSIEDEQGLTTALIAAREQRARLAAMGEANRRRSQDWDWDSIAARTEQLYTAFKKKELTTETPRHRE